MSSFKKLSLVSQDELTRLKQKQLTSYNPELRAMVLLKDEMDDILMRADLSPEEKLKLFQTAQHRFASLKPQVQVTSVAQSKAEPTAEEEPQQAVRAEHMGPSSSVTVSPFAKVLASLPKTFHKKATDLAEFFDEHKGHFASNAQGELVIDGQAIAKSNFKDLIRHLYIEKRQVPHGLNEFVASLKALNVPRTSLSNKKIIEILDNDPDVFYDSPLGTMQTGSGRLNHNRTKPPGKRPRILFLYKR